MVFDEAYVQSWMLDIIAEVGERHGIKPNVPQPGVVKTLEDWLPYDVDLRSTLEDRGREAQVHVDSIEHAPLDPPQPGLSRCRVKLTCIDIMRGLT
jgi:hypothetical protein